MEKAKAAYQLWTETIKKKEMQSSFTYCYTNMRRWETKTTVNTDYTKIVVTFNNFTQKYNIIERSYKIYTYDEAADRSYRNSWTEISNNLNSHGTEGYPVYNLNDVYSNCFNDIVNQSSKVEVDTTPNSEPFLQKCGIFYTQWNAVQEAPIRFELYDFKWNDTCDYLNNSSNITHKSYSLIIIMNCILFLFTFLL
ncbi:hypothetical protein ABK040_011792 [Willaertia magna]